MLLHNEPPLFSEPCYNSVPVASFNVFRLSISRDQVLSTGKALFSTRSPILLYSRNSHPASITYPSFVKTGNSNLASESKGSISQRYVQVHLPLFCKIKSAEWLSCLRIMMVLDCLNLSVRCTHLQADDKITLRWRRIRFYLKP